MSAFKVVWCLFLLFCAFTPGAAASFDAFVADSLEKVAAEPAASASLSSSGEIYLDAVRGEYENAQIVAAAGDRDVTLSLAVAPVTGPGGPKPSISAAFLGYVPIRKGTPDIPDTHLVAKPPVGLPDPILESKSTEVPAGRNQPVWITTWVPRSCAPGLYRSSVTIASAFGDEATIPVTVRVRPILLPAQRNLEITNWLSPGNVASGHQLEMWSDGYWKMLEAYARLMSDYRQTAIRTLLFDLITATEDEQGRLTFDFTRFDRWVRLFQEAGVLGTIEGSHLAWRTDWESHQLVGHRPVTTLPDGSRKDWGRPGADSAEQREFLSQFLPALLKHLDQMGWAGHYIQHLADEPVAANATQYNALAAMVREFAPGVKIIDATMCREVAGSVDIWVPQPSEIDRHPEFFQQRRDQGEQVWIYTCLAPRGRYMNRFIYQNLLSPRLIHWMNYRYAFPGYLHWGLNFWQGDPYTNVERGYPNPNNLPAGDSHVVYPGRRGPLPSIRLDAMRDGIEDYELLRLLSLQDQKAAKEICSSVVRSMTDYTLDPAEFRQARKRLLDELELLQQGP